MPTFLITVFIIDIYNNLFVGLGYFYTSQRVQFRYIKTAMRHKKDLTSKDKCIVNLLREAKLWKL